MAISKDIEIKINGDKAAFSEKFYIYHNDRGIQLNISINTSKFQINQGNASLLSDLNGGVCAAVILKPNGQIISRGNMPISDGVVKFMIDHELTNDLDEIGIYTIQFHIYDNNDNRITIPPVSFEVKGLIGIIPDTF